MTEFLLFTIYAPLSSWGDIAVGESRDSWDRPSRSAVLGFLGAAMGIEREDRSAHDSLDTGYGTAVRLDAAGVPLTDYHTAQTVGASAVRKRRPATRAELLSAGERETILSRRAYRLDALATIALWSREGARWTLAELADALRRPIFTLYAGRKANALGLPLDPVLVESETLAGALGARTHDKMRRVGLSLERLRLAAVPEVSHDPCLDFDTGLRALRTEVRRDASPDRTRWQFRERVVEVGALESALSSPEDT